MTRKAAAIIREMKLVQSHKEGLDQEIYNRALQELMNELKEAYGRPHQEQGALPLDTPQQPQDAAKKSR